MVYLSARGILPALILAHSSGACTPFPRCTCPRHLAGVWSTSGIGVFCCVSHGKPPFEFPVLSPETFQEVQTGLHIFHDDPGLCTNSTGTSISPLQVGPPTCFLSDYRNKITVFCSYGPMFSEKVTGQSIKFPALLFWMLYFVLDSVAQKDLTRGSPIFSAPSDRAT